MEDAGCRCRRGYFGGRPGGAQFAVPGGGRPAPAPTDPPSSPQTQVLAAADLANPYGAALPWLSGLLPGSTGSAFAIASGRKAGAVILVDGDLVLYVERRPHPAHLHRPPRPPGQGGRTPSPWPSATVPSAASPSRRPTAAPCSTPRWPGKF